MPRNSRNKDLKPLKLCRPSVKSLKPSPKTSRTNEKRLCCINIGSENKEKWSALKVKLKFSTDTDFASFLLEFYVKESNSPSNGFSTESQNQLTSRPNESTEIPTCDGKQKTPPIEASSSLENKRLAKKSSLEEDAKNSSVIVVNKVPRPEYEGKGGLNSKKEIQPTVTKGKSGFPTNGNTVETLSQLSHQTENPASKQETGNTLVKVSKAAKVSTKQKNKKIKHTSPVSREFVETEDTSFKQRRKKLKSLENSPPSPLGKPLEEPATVASLKNELTENEVLHENAAFRLHPPAEVVAVNIQLCDDCELHHDQDACPLQKPIAVVCDATTKSEWASRTNIENDAAKSFAEASLPCCLELRVLDAKQGASVIARESVPAFTQFGPLVAHSLLEREIPDDSTMEHVWEVTEGSSCRYLTTSDPNTSNWLRFVRPAAVRSSRNLEVVSRGGQLMFVTTAVLNPGEELQFWAENRNPSWSHKRLCKTKCGGCNLSFSHTLYYRLHCAVFHDPAYSLTVRKYHCKVCGSSVLGKENIVKHAAEKHNGKGAYQCQYCHKFFLRLNYLEMHRTYGCAANPNRARPLCDYCGRKFCQPQKLKVHIKRMHSEMLEVLRDFQCKHCMKLLGSRAALQRHVKEVHRKDVVGAFTCDRCGKLFQNKSNLKIHMLTHSGVKPFKCKEPDCPAGFTTKQCLQSHYRKIHGIQDSCMPHIERAVEYTFDAYAGTRRPSSVNSDSLCSSDGEEALNEDQQPLSPPISVTGDQISELPQDSFNNSIMSKASKKWMGQTSDNDKPNVFDFDDEDKDQDINVSHIEDEPIPMLFHHCKQDSSNASLLVEAALDAAEREIEGSKLPSPLSLVSNKEPYPIRMPQSPLSLSRPMSPVEYPIQDQSQSPHLPMESCYSAPSLSPRHPYSLMFPERGSHYDFRLSPPPQMDNFPQEELRYDVHHRREEPGEDIVQNLSLGLKSKPLDIGYKYDSLDDRGFECSEGLDMSRTSYHHSFVSMVPRYPHSLYEPRGYSHTDVLRVVNLSHSVDLSLPRSHHQLSAPVSQSMEPIRILSPPPPPQYQAYPLATSPSPSPYNRPPLSPSFHHYNTSY